MQGTSGQVSLHENRILPFFSSLKFPVRSLFERRYADPIFIRFVVTHIFVNYLHVNYRFISDSPNSQIWVTFPGQGSYRLEKNDLTGNWMDHHKFFHPSIWGILISFHLGVCVAGHFSRGTRFKKNYSWNKIMKKLLVHRNH